MIPNLTDELAGVPKAVSGLKSMIPATPVAASRLVSLRMSLPF